MTLQESARVMLHAKQLRYHFWAESMNIDCYIHNRVTLRSGTSATLYELWKGRKPIFKYLHEFGSKCYILAICEQRIKMDPKKWMKEYFRGTLQTTEPIDFLIP